jgi:hypothetical protein
MSRLVARGLPLLYGVAARPVEPGILELSRAPVR